MHVRSAFVAMVFASAGFPACAEEPAAPSATRQAMEAAAAGARLLAQERQRFDAMHSLKGEVGEKAVGQLRSAGYRCFIGHLDLVKLAEDGVSFRTVRTPLVFCRQPSTLAGDVCAERHANLTVDWQDPTAAEPALQAQLATSKVIGRTFRCVPPGEVGR